MGCNEHEISILIADDTTIRKLNKEYRGMDKPTNVLAFPMQEGEFTQISPGLLGDVVISGETARAEADRVDISLMERMSQLLIHGILHLVGFDHETDEKNAKKMEDKSLELLKLIEPNEKLKAF